MLWSGFGTRLIGEFPLPQGQACGKGASRQKAGKRTRLSLSENELVLPQMIPVAACARVFRTASNSAGCKDGKSAPVLQTLNPTTISTEQLTR